MIDCQRSLTGIVAILLAAVVLSLAGAAFSRPAEAGGAQIGFDPNPATIPLGGGGTVAITVANVNNLGGYDLFVQFDPSVVELSSLSDGGFVTGGGNIVVCNDATIDNVAGTGTISCATVSPLGTPVPGVSTVAPRSLALASFKVVGNGASPLALAGTALQDPNGAPIGASLSGGLVNVSGAVGGIAELSRASEAGLVDEARAGEASRFSNAHVAAAAAVLVFALGAAGVAVAAHRR